ncbi:MAG: rsbU11, partial [Ilumatobacteraceae bacterium]|nr:rsbU11 [Ilumatobacteraceae bacterium]
AQELSAAESTIDISHIVSTTGRLVLDALYVNILTVDHAKGQMSTVHSPSVDADIIRRYSSLAIDELTPPGSAIVRGKPMVAETFADYSRQWPGVAADAAAVGVRSASAVPLFRSDGTIMGALSAGWDTEVEFAPLLRSTLSTLSRMAAAALERGQAGDARKGFVLALQHALLPVLPQLTGLDVAARYLPANSELGFGGDWYDIFAVTPTLSAVIVGDVCGHGIQAAATMAQLRGSINALVRINTDSLERVFDQAEDWLIGEPDFIATVAVHLIDTTQDIIHTVYAGHPPSVIVHADGRSEVLEAGRRPLLGAGGRPPVVGTAQFECGAVLVAFTDGLVERRGQNIDEGTDRVSDVVAAAAGGTCEQIAVSLEEAIDWVPTDDVAFAIVQRTTG